jgi:ATP-binding cassette subfamily C protein
MRHRKNEIGMDGAAIGPVRHLLRFSRDFARACGMRGVLAGIAVLASAALESVALILLVPLFAVTIGAMPTEGMLARVLRSLFAVLDLGPHLPRLMFLLGAFAALMVLRLVIGAVRDLLLAQLQIEFVDGLRTHAIGRLGEARWDVVSRMRQARVAQLVSADIQRIGLAARLSQQSLVAAVMLAAQCVAALIVSPALALMCLALIGLGFLSLMVTLRRAHLLGESVTGTNLATMNTIVQFFGGLKLAISQDLHRSYVSEVQDSLRNLAERQLDFVRFQAIRQIALGTLAAVVGIAICAVGLGLLGVRATVLVGLLLILMRMSGPAMVLQQNAQQLVQALPAYDALQALNAELEAAAVSYSPVVTDRVFDGAITFDGVAFDHGGEGGGLSGISVRIEPGSFLGIAGPSGAGKTSFVDLLVGLHRPVSGAIRIGDTVLDDATIVAWRRQVSYVGQDPYLFYDSIRRNLLWAKPEASEAELWEALRLAGAEDLVRTIPGGLDASVGERGTLVSGGERQRLAIARALIRRPRLMILDEATNAIDVAGERAVIASLLALENRPTIVMIAHRSESLERCDRILHFEGGRIVSDEAR